MGDLCLNNNFNISYSDIVGEQNGVNAKLF